jgi:EAL domain-containing protein (putative c-di-GMP-specific phosphodiesterase class I)
MGEWHRHGLEAQLAVNLSAPGILDPDLGDQILGCDYARGSLISPPLPAARVAPFVSQANQLLPASDSTVMQIRALDPLAGRSGR